MELPLDYATLRLIWWGLLGVLLIAFALTDGFDLGVGALLPFVARTDEERRMVINTVGATWEGNQVWFITGGAAIFAAWPLVYAVSFSGFYLAMFLVLSALILRPVGFKYRSKRASPAWRSFWDWALFVGGFVPALVFGVAVGNVLLGVPFRLDSDLRSFYEGTLLGLFTPFTLICGLLSVTMLVLHGAAWLGVKAERGPIQERARMIGIAAAVLGLVLFVGGGLFVAYGPLGFAITGAIDPGGLSNPLRTAVEARPMSAIGIISTVGLSMFPFILPSSIDPQSSLTVWNSSSSHVTLFTMLVVTVIFLPIILVYTAWVYRVLWGRSTTEALRTNPDLY